MEDIQKKLIEHLMYVKSKGLEGNQLSFRNMDLRGEVFDNVYFYKVDFDGANLSGASFKGTTLDSINMEHTNCSHCDFTNSLFLDCYLNESDFSQAVWDKAILLNCFTYKATNLEYKSPSHQKLIDTAQHFIDNNERLKDTYKKVQEATDNILKPEVLYHAYVYVMDNGSSGGGYYYIDDQGNRNYLSPIRDIIDTQLRDEFDWAYQLFPPNTLVHRTLKRSQLPTVKGMGVKDLLEYIRSDIIPLPFPGSKLPEYTDFELTLNYQSKGEELGLSLRGIDYRTTPTTKIDRLPYGWEDPFKCLYYALDGKIKKIWIRYKKDSLIAQSIPAFPEHNIPLFKENLELPDLANDNLSLICEYLESGEEHKINHAIKSIKQNQQTSTFIKKRYDNLVATRLQKTEVNWADYSKGLLTPIDTKIFVNEQERYNLLDNIITFEYLKDYESKVLVDYMGSIIKNHLDMNSFIDKVKETSEESELITILDTEINRIKAELNQALGIYPDGWYEILLNRLLNIKLSKVTFQKTSFTEANTSLVLREYMFFLAMLVDAEEESFCFDIYQSDTPDLTEMFWLFRFVPDTIWIEVEPSFPNSPLTYKRDAYFRTEDEVDWELFQGEANRLADKAESYYNEGYFNIALDFINRAIDLEDDSLRFYVLKGAICGCLGYTKESLEAMSKAIKMEESETTLTNRAILYKQIGEDQKALRDMERVIEIDPDSSEAYTFIANIYHKMKDIDKVWTYLQLAATKDPYNMGMHLDTIELYMLEECFEEGVQYIHEFEDQILEDQEEGMRLLYLYLKACIYTGAGISIEAFESELRALLSQKIPTGWSLKYTREWLDKTKISKEAHEKITELTDLLDY
ncbi:pentapeptide repeat-containing protein [Spirochaeta cellobiosiphila]|uniref:pentapeptide repeat-containing protein n=1 Tax=Spirochaeta cellobiosiphila TaxID=504483 RepID=UPI0004203639|nr:pentapeptide repeat-containing protein [Spirochaeta cellobiosiphila]